MNAAAANPERKTALITGASSGIGLEMAKIFARSGYNLILVARGEIKLRELAESLTKETGIQATVLAKDLAQPNAPHEIFKAVERQGLTVDVLVNNAGIGSYGPFIKTDETQELELLQVNVVAYTLLAKLFGRDMAARGGGKILNVASTAAYQPGPLMAVYYASKAYALSLSEALSSELAESGVAVTALCPGPVRTGFQDRAGMKKSKLLMSMKPAVLDAATVARAGYDALMAGRRVVIPGFVNWLMAASARFTPKFILLPMIKFMQKETA